jgi:hypothetical protein
MIRARSGQNDLFGMIGFRVTMFQAPLAGPIPSRPR